MDIGGDIMITTLYTGDRRDFILLIAETPAECCQLVRVATSEFIQPDKVYLDSSDDSTVKLRIWVSDKVAQPMTKALAAELDQETY